MKHKINPKSYNNGRAYAKKNAGDLIELKRIKIRFEDILLNQPLESSEYSFYLGALDHINNIG